VANLGSAESYKQSHFESKEIQDVLAKAQYFYCTGFFLTHSPQVLVALGKLAATKNKKFLMNIAAPFLVNFFWDQMSSVLPYTDVVFCNEDEAEALGTKLGWGTDLPTVAAKLADYPKENKSTNRIVIFTQGAKQTIVYADGKTTYHTPIPCKQEEIVDTNGAGDSFVGGFLSRYIQQKSLDECVAAAHYCALECIKKSGCTFPSVPKFEYH